MTKNIDKIIKLLKKDCGKYTNPIVTEVSDLTKDPFKVLISCVLSLRTKDQTTAKAAKRLFEKADTPQKLLKLYLKEIEKLIYPVGFYKTKARNLKEICKDLIEIYNGEVPNDFEDKLMKVIPKKYWHDYNDLLVKFGQNVCLSVSPLCSKCVVNKYCPKIGVKRSR